MFDFCGIGNACIDIVARVDDAFLRDWNFPKSICSYLELDRANALEAALLMPEYIPGGCGANTAACISALGGQSVFMGRIAKDAIGQRLIDDMVAWNIRYVGIPDESAGAGSTRIFALITPDTERTFAAYYGVQEDLSEADLDPKGIAQSKFMYLDGYALNSSHGGETFLKAAHIAHKAGQQVVLSPSDLSILEKYPDVIADLTRASDMILCNEQEAKFIARTDDLMEAIKHLQGQFTSGTVSVGADGVYAFDQNSVQRIEAAALPGPVFDTNGAGDAFAGGFLFGLSRGFGMEKAARLGNRCAAAIITHAGARPKDDYKRFLKDL